jgi:hypothetical protein
MVELKWTDACQLERAKASDVTAEHKTFLTAESDVGEHRIWIATCNNITECSAVASP